MRRIELTQGYHALVDDEDYDRLSEHKWHAFVRKEKPCRKVYAVRNMRVETDDGARRQKRVWMHREIMATGEGFEVDHIDGDSLNNRKSNLRQATGDKNRKNRKAATGSSSKFVGVSAADNGRFRAGIAVNGKWKSLGRFANEIDAAKARDVAAMAIYGEFAHLNLPELTP